MNRAPPGAPYEMSESGLGRRTDRAARQTIQPPGWQKRSSCPSARPGTGVAKRLGDGVHHKSEEE
jgi:hypothetical protein